MYMYHESSRTQQHSNGIVWVVQTSHSTCTCTVTLHVIEPPNTPKFRIIKKIFRNDENRIRICWFSAEQNDGIRKRWRLLPLLFNHGVSSNLFNCSNGLFSPQRIMRCTPPVPTLGRSIQNVRFSRIKPMLPTGFNGVSSQTQAPCGEKRHASVVMEDTAARGPSKSVT